MLNNNSQNHAVPFPLEQLPKDILGYTFNFLDTEDFSRLSQVNTKWRAVISSAFKPDLHFRPWLHDAEIIKIIAEKNTNEFQKSLQIYQQLLKGNKNAPFFKFILTKNFDALRKHIATLNPEETENFLLNTCDNFGYPISMWLLVSNDGYQHRILKETFSISLKNAMQRNDLFMLETLLKNPILDYKNKLVTINPISGGYIKPTFYAAYTGNKDVLDFLFSNHEKFEDYLTLVSDKNKSPQLNQKNNLLHYVVRNGQIETLKWLKQKFINCHPSTIEYEKIEALFNQYLRFGTYDALQYAALYLQFDMMRHLIWKENFNSFSNYPPHATPLVLIKNKIFPSFSTCRSRGELEKTTQTADAFISFLSDMLVYEKQLQNNLQNNNNNTSTQPSALSIIITNHIEQTLHEVTVMLQNFDIVDSIFAPSLNPMVPPSAGNIRKVIEHAKSMPYIYPLRNKLITLQHKLAQRTDQLIPQANISFRQRYFLAIDRFNIAKNFAFFIGFILTCLSITHFLAPFFGHTYFLSNFIVNYGLGLGLTLLFISPAIKISSHVYLRLHSIASTLQNAIGNVFTNQTHRHVLVANNDSTSDISETSDIEQGQSSDSEEATEKSDTVHIDDILAKESYSDPLGRKNIGNNNNNSDCEKDDLNNNISNNNNNLISKQV